MPEQDPNAINRPSVEPIATNIFDTLATQFPVCMESDEFHYFPQARAKAADWSRWDDFSPGAIDTIVGRLIQWEKQIDRCLLPKMPSAQAMDADMLKRVVQTLGEQLTLVKAHEIQPTFYLTIAGIGLAEAYAAGSQAFNARLETLPAFLDQGRSNLKQMPRLFRDLGLDMLDKQRAWLHSRSLPDALRAPIDRALQRFDHHLGRARVKDAFLPSLWLYEKIAHNHVGCGLRLHDIARALDQEIKETGAILERSAESIAPGRTWQDAVDGLPRPPMPTGGLGELYHSIISELARHCTANGLIDPELVQSCPVAVAPIPAYMRPVRSNAAYSMPPQHPPRGGTFFIQDAGRTAAIPADFRLLTAHETFPGHHLLDTSRWGHARWIRRHIEFPIFYEGWASFAEELMFDTGFFSTPADRLLMAKRRFWRAMRGKVDFDIHTRRRSLDDAAANLVSAGMAPQRARAMVRRYCLKPGYQLAYTIGRRRFRFLYDAYCQHGAAPVAFARGVLAQGEIGFNHLEQTLRQGG